MKNPKLAFSIIALILIHITSFAQQTIQQQFEKFNKKETSEWQEFQLIKKPKLEQFWQVVTDTLKVKDQTISAEKVKVKKLTQELATTKETLTATALDLEESEAKADAIGFLGIQLNKIVYNMIVWTIIWGLLVMVGVVYMMFQRSHLVTRKAQKALQDLDIEYQEHKDKAREVQAKIKRELQTAHNTLQEHRINI